jgi:hypothetical protein
MSRRLSLTLLVVALSILIAVPVYALPGKPDFNPHIYVDGEAWGTKVTAVLPPPKGNNAHSFQPLYVFSNAPNDQLLVATAAPGDMDYRGGRWVTFTVTWTAEGMAAHDPLPLLTRYGPASDPDSILFHENLGHLEVTKGSFQDGPPEYFSCPLLPVK